MSHARVHAVELVLGEAGCGIGGVVAAPRVVCEGLVVVKSILLGCFCTVSDRSWKRKAWTSLIITGWCD